MGLFSKKRTISAANISYYYPQDKIKYGKPDKKRYLFDQLLTKRMISNDVDGLSGTDNVHDLVKSANFLHTPSFVPTQTKFCSSIVEGIISLSTDKITEKINNLKELIGTSANDSLISYQYVLTKALDTYDINSNTFIKDGFKWTIDKYYEKAKASYITPPTPPEVTDPMPVVPMLPALPKPLDFWLFAS